MDIRNTAAIVTGAASGLGAATAEALAVKGAHVFGVDLNIDNASAIDGVTYVSADVANADDVRAAVVQAAAGAPLRTVVNCAGIGPSARIVGSKGTHDLDLYAKVIRVNLLGTFTVLATAAAAMAATEPDNQGQRGVVINTASIAAFDGQVGQAAYASSKGGVVGLTLPAARDLAQHGIRVMTIAPGVMLTPLLMTVSDDVRADLSAGVPFPTRLGDPSEFAHLALAIVENDYLNGEVIRIDGSLRMAPR